MHFIYIYIHSFLWVNLFIADISADVCHYLIIALADKFFCLADVSEA